MTANFEALGKKLGLNEETQGIIVEEWNKKLSEAREEISADLREEFAQKFSHDKKLVIESVDRFLTEQITAEIKELAEDKKKLAAERVAYRTKVKEHAKVLDEFIMRQLKNEIKEHRSERKEFVNGLNTLENFVLTQLAEEIKEFHGDKKALREQRVKVVTEARKEIAEAKQNFVAKAAKVIEESIDKTLRSEISQFRNDIKVAKENDFGRRVFEGFVAEYATSLLNENGEIAKIRKEIGKKEAEVNKVMRKLAEAVEQKQKVEKQLNITKDKLERDRVMRKLLKPLGREKANVMHDLLESVQTTDLERAYNKYLPAVLNESKVITQSRQRKVINEDVKTERTGDRAKQTAQTGRNDSVDDIEMIKRLAGIIQ